MNTKVQRIKWQIYTPLKANKNKKTKTYTSWFNHERKEMDIATTEYTHLIYSMALIGLAASTSLTRLDSEMVRCHSSILRSDVKARRESARRAEASSPKLDEAM